MTLKLAKEKAFSTIERARTLKDVLRGTGTPMFTTDQVFATSHFLDHLIRGIFVKLGVSKEDFNEMYARYTVEVLGLPKANANHNKGNLTKPLRNGNISPMVFQRTLAVLKLYLTDVSISVIDTDGEETTFRLSEFKEECRKAAKGET
jgi:hypothetical protein